MSDNLYRSASYEVWICSSSGVRLHLLDTFIDLKFSRAVSSVGRAIINIDSTDFSIFRFVKPDFIVQIWRSFTNEIPKLEFIGFIRKIRIFQMNRSDIIEVTCEDQISILTSRIVAYTSEGTESELSGFADDICKDIVRYNLGASAPIDRDLTTYGFQVAPDLSLAAPIQIPTAWNIVLDALKKVSENSFFEGIPLFFDCIPVIGNSSVGFEFQTFAQQLGNDRTYESGVPTVFSAEFGNLENPSLEFDFTDEKTVVYGGGQGESNKRQIFVAEDTERSNISPWNRRELFFNANSARTSSMLENVTNQVLEANRPRVKFTGQLKDTLQTRYGIDWRYGDRIAVSYRGIIFNAWINAVSFSLSSTSQETIQARAEVLTQL